MYRVERPFGIERTLGIYRHGSVLSLWEPERDDFDLDSFFLRFSNRGISLGPGLFLYGPAGEIGITRRFVRAYNI